MARQDNVDAVTAAIDMVYRNCGSTRPAKAEIIAEAGVSHKTFYRVLANYPEVKRQLDLAEIIFDRRPDLNINAVSPDPLKANPFVAISELLDTIAKLTEVIESQRKRIRTLEQQVGMTPASIADRAARGSGETDKPRRSPRRNTTRL